VAGLGCRRAEDERTRGLGAAGLARTAGGASTVTGGNIVCAFVIEEARQSALQSTSVLALCKA